MAQTEYENKKRECWEEFQVLNSTTLETTKQAFDWIFDRAYALGKQTETVSQEEVEEVAKKYAAEVDKNVCGLYGIENPPASLTFGECAAESFREGVNFALGKQIETISQEEIEKAANEFADREYEIGQVDWDALYKGYYHGMKDALGKQEKDADVIQGWVARDKDGCLWMFAEKPMRRFNNYWKSETVDITLSPTLFPDLTWESDPEPVEIILKRKKK